MRYWFFVMTFMSATAFGNQSSEEHYQQIEQDFANGSVPTLEQLTAVPWRTGRCIFRENVGELRGAALSIFKQGHGPYYSSYYAYFLMVRKNFLPNIYDSVSSDQLLAAAINTNEPAMFVTENSIIIGNANINLYLRFFNDILLLSDEEDSNKRVVMCYYFREVTE